MDITAAAACLTVADPARSTDFYTRQFGFECVQDLREKGRTVRAVLRHGDATLLIASGDPETSRTGHAALYLFVASAREAHQALAAAGAEVADVALTTYGMEEFHLRDPDGHVIAIGSPAVQLA